jgi:hypothetical protein
MSQTTPTVSVPADVRAFAARHQVEALLPIAVDLARRHFPKAEVSLELEPPYSLDDPGAILVRVEKAEMTVDEALAAKEAYDRDFREHLPRPDPCVFSLVPGLSQ